VDSVAYLDAPEQDDDLEEKKTGESPSRLQPEHPTTHNCYCLGRIAACCVSICWNCFAPELNTCGATMLEAVLSVVA